MISNLMNVSNLSMFAAADEGSFSFPPQASTFGPGVDFLYYAITAISAFFFVIIVGVMVYFVMKYRRRPGVDVLPSPSHNTALEVAWSVLPAGILVYIFGAGFLGWLDMKNAPSTAREVSVQASSWSWLFTYPGSNSISHEELHIPVDESVRLSMQSSDVIHSLFVPAFRAKQDIVPGRYSTLWFQATRPGKYSLYCAEYCGQKHSLMTTSVVVHESGGFEQWLQDEIDKMDEMDPVELGALMYKRQGCFQCHSIDGNNDGKAGPSFYQSFGTEQSLADGTKVTVDENYIRQSILEPYSQVRSGFQPVMPTYKGRLKDAHINGLVQYIKSLKK